MTIRMLSKSLLSFLLLSLVSFTHNPAVAAQSAGAAQEEFKGRVLYFTVKWISPEDLYAKRNDVAIVDVRSKYEYETLHIKSAVNIAIGSTTFAEELKKLHKADPKKMIVFYCNGRTCMKSYEAALKAVEQQIPNVVAYDAGIFEWADKYPSEAVLLGVSPLDKSRLISTDKLAQHVLSPGEFEQRIGADAIVLDVRDAFQQEATALFPLRQHSIPLDNKALKQYVEQAKREKKTLLIYDATGHQVSWLQYYLEAESAPSYYFMRGGAKAYYDDMLKAMPAAKR